MSFEAFTPNARLRIGCFCSIGDDCKIMVGGAGRHYYDFATTSPLSMIFRNPAKADQSSVTQGDLAVCIGSDVWIGEDATIGAGVRIGHGAVIGSKSLVLEDVPPLRDRWRRSGAAVKVSFYTRYHSSVPAVAVVGLAGHCYFRPYRVVLFGQHG